MVDIYFKIGACEGDKIVGAEHVPTIAETSGDQATCHVRPGLIAANEHHRAVDDRQRCRVDAASFVI